MKINDTDLCYLQTDYNSIQSCHALQWQGSALQYALQFILQYVLRHVRSLFQSEFSTGCDLVLPLSISNAL
jgi:hypothetical protein